MSIEEILIIIAAATIVTTIIQCMEMLILIRNQRYTNHLLENVGHLAGDCMEQFIEDLLKDKDKEAAWFGFVRMCGQHALGAAREAVMPKMPKIRTLGDAIGMIMQMPGVQAAAEAKAKKIIEGVAEKSVETGLQW